MEGRKLQLTGGSTYVVSLPKRWVLDAGLKAGDTVFLETEGDGAVSVRPRPADKVPMRRRLFEEKGEERRDHLLRKLIGAYIGGFSFIEIRSRPRWPRSCERSRGNSATWSSGRKSSKSRGTRSSSRIFRTPPSSARRSASGACT